MNLYDKIMQIYPDLTISDFAPNHDATIILQDDTDGKGAYIASWTHPVYKQPTDEQLKAIGE